MNKTLQEQFHPDLEKVIERLHIIGKEIISVHAESVDRDARFPKEAFEAFKKEKWLSSYVSKDLGGMGFSIVDLAKMCEVMGTYCGSTAMIFAMHQIQVACITHHALSSSFFKNYIKDLVANQYLLASATTEKGIGGDVRSSICCAEYAGDMVSATKEALVISYAEAADAILVTCRKNAEASRHDQIHILAKKGDYHLKEIMTWDTLGFRGTCSVGYTLTVKCKAEQILPMPYADIHAKSMHPFSHIIWSCLWYGIAHEAVSRSRVFVKLEAKKNPETPPFSAIRLAEVDSDLFVMRNCVYQQVSEYKYHLESGNDEIFKNFGFALRNSNLKMKVSTMMINIVNQSMMICGISGYRNDTKTSLTRLLRDSYGAAIMVNNDRILLQSSTLQLFGRD